VTEFSADQIWNNLLREIARQAYDAGFNEGDNECDPDFEEWWETFAEQHRTDG
jgi:hypothetical protein